MYQYIDVSVLDISCTIVRLCARTVFLLSRLLFKVALPSFITFSVDSRNVSQTPASGLLLLFKCDLWQTCGMKEAPSAASGHCCEDTDVKSEDLSEQLKL